MAMDGIGHDIWTAVANEFSHRQGRRAHDLWIQGAVPVSLRRGLFVLQVVDESVKSVIDARYRDDIEAIFLQVTGSPVRLRTQVDEPHESVEAPRGTPAPEDGAADASATPAARRAARRRARRQDEATLTGHAPFVVTERSRLAHAAMERWVQGGAGGFSPLFVHGPTGVGKTALAAEALRRLTVLDPDVDPLVLSAESLSQDVGRAHRERDYGRLQASWNGRDVIVIDEAHRLRGKSSTQDVVLSLITPVIEHGGRVMLLSRHRASDIHGINDRLRSHFRSALAVELSQPDTAGREAVLGGVLEELGVLASEEVVPELAERGPESVGEAVSVLRMAAERARSAGRLLVADDVAGRLAPRSRGDELLDRLIGLISDETGIDIDRIRSSEKSRDVASARHLCVYLAARSIGLSSRQISRSIRQRSPSIVAYSRRKVERRRFSDAAFDALVRRIQDGLDGAQRELSWPV